MFLLKGVIDFDSQIQQFPLIYPYSINCIDIINYGYLRDERAVENIAFSDDGAEDIPVHNIVNFTFDNNYFLAETYSKFEDEKPKFLLFRFADQKIEKFDRFSDLLTNAKSIGYSGPDSLITVREFDKIFR